jgi:hypothetical protein
MPPKPAASPPADGLGFSPTLLYSLVFSLNQITERSQWQLRPLLSPFTPIPGVQSRQQNPRSKAQTAKLRRTNANDEHAVEAAKDFGGGMELWADCCPVELRSKARCSKYRALGRW